MSIFRKIIDQLKEWFQTDRRRQLEEADAIVLEFYLTDLERNGEVETRLLLQVTPKYGRNYVAECHQYFPEKYVQLLCLGKRIKIFHPRNNHMKIVDMVVG